MAARMFLPSISEVEEADERCGLFMSSLDALASSVEALSSNDHSHEDEWFAEKNGIELEHRPRYISPATLARGLVFADEVLDDLDVIRENATKLRAALLRLYRYKVIEPSGRERAEAVNAR